MGYYVCPRCGSNETYLGNALINKKGTSLTREMGDSGLYVTGTVGGGTETVQVRKCKKCSELLGPSNYVKSQEEITQDSEKHSRKIKVAAALILATLVLALWIRSWMLNSVH